MSLSWIGVGVVVSVWFVCLLYAGLYDSYRELGIISGKQKGVRV